MQILILTLILFFASTQNAQAYLDPGTGSYILQLIIGGALGGVFLLKNYWQSLKGFFSRNKTKSDDHETNSQEE